MILTYFQVDVRVQFFQRFSHAVSLDASQLRQRNTELLATDAWQTSEPIHPVSHHQISMKEKLS